MVKRMMFVVCIFAFGLVLTCPIISHAAPNFGDYRSTTLISKAWAALGEKNLEDVLVYTNKCIELYAAQAKKMQASLTAYPTGKNEEIFSYWALNDVATGYFIQGEAYRNAGKKDEAKAAYQKVIDEYSYGQCWDTGGWFWKPAEAAKEKLAAIESGSTIDFGDMKSSTLATKAWEALAKDDVKAVNAYANKCLELYSPKAQEMQKSLTEYPWETKEKIFEYWALNDVGTCLFIQGEVNKKTGNKEEAIKSFEKLIKEYSFAQCWDPQGWFWKPAEAAQQRIDEFKGS